MSDAPTDDAHTKRTKMPGTAASRKRTASVASPIVGCVIPAASGPASASRQPAAVDLEVQWYYRIFETEFGPLSFQTVCELVKSRQLGADDRVRSSDRCYWQAVHGVTALQPLIRIAEATSNEVRGTGDQSKAGSAPDEWYYRIEEREHGPFTLAALQDLIGTSGQTAEQVLVRQVGEEEWVSFLELPANSELTRLRGGRAEKGAVDARAASSNTRRSSVARPANDILEPRRTMRQRARENRDILVAVALWSLINAGILLARSDPYATERNDLLTLRRLEKDAIALQSRGASADEWNTLRVKSKETLAPIVNDLKRTASASAPIRQHLLWAARDQFPRIVGPKTVEMKEPERLYEQHMRFVEDALAER